MKFFLTGSSFFNACVVLSLFSFFFLFEAAWMNWTCPRLSIHMPGQHPHASSVSSLHAFLLATLEISHTYTQYQYFNSFTYWSYYSHERSSLKRKKTIVSETGSTQLLLMGPSLYQYTYTIPSQPFHEPTAINFLNYSHLTSQFTL